MELIQKGVIYKNRQVVKDTEGIDLNTARKKTMAYRILDMHDNHTDENLLHITFDSLTSHDITYVGIIQTARASGMKRFCVPYVLTNCHNSLCAVGGTINEDDHAFALSACKKYGGIYVPPCFAVIHSYNREMMSGCGRMILGSDSHTRYGALGTMGIGEGGGELAKQLVQRTYDIERPKVILVHVTGKLRPGVGPHDVALSLVQATYENGFVKNKVMEFVGEGISSLSQDTRNGIDVMTTETTCLSSIWETDDITRKYYKDHHREEDYAKMSPMDGAYYDGCIELDLSKVECMISLPMHPSKAVSIRDLKKNPREILGKCETEVNAQFSGKATLDLLSKIDSKGKIHVEQGIIAGCSGGIYENIMIASKILEGGNLGNSSFKLSVYPDSLPVYKALAQNGTLARLAENGVVVREAFCGPCFGAGDTPANGELSLRHTTRNFPNREGSKPTEGQLAGVCLMDARSIAATAANQGILTAGDELVTEDIPVEEMTFDSSIYEKRVYNGWNRPEESAELKFGPNIKDWPEQNELSEDVLIKTVSYITDPVTTTDELIPSGETSSYRSNPLRLADFTLSRKDPDYVPLAKAVKEMDEKRREGVSSLALTEIKKALAAHGIQLDIAHTNIVSGIYANKPGDGSAREQAASCQRVLGGGANIAREYATKRYRTNCINWGILPFVTKEADKLKNGDWIFIKGIRTSLLKDKPVVAYIIREDRSVVPFEVSLGPLDRDEKEILLDGCLINHYRKSL